MRWGEEKCEDMNTELKNKSWPEKYPSPVPRQVFSRTLAEQEKELKTSERMLRFAESRQKLAADPYRPAYHFVSPESQLNDPNGLCFWQGRWHLFYQAYPPDELPEPGDIPKRRQHWGHIVSAISTVSAVNAFQNRPFTFPSAVISTSMNAGWTGRPGMVRISPQSG